MGADGRKMSPIWAEFRNCMAHQSRCYDNALGLFSSDKNRFGKQHKEDKERTTGTGLRHDTV